MKQKQQLKKKAIVEALEKSGGNITQACGAVGINRCTYYRWLADDKEFSEACREIKESLVDEAESKLYDQIQQGNLTAIIFYLKTQAKHRGYTEHHTAPDTAERKILTDYAAGTIDIIQAATKYAMIGRPLPDVLRMQLSKMEPPEADAGDEGVYTDEELEADFQAMQAKVETEKDRWLPDRRAAVTEMKKELDGNQRAGGEKEGAIHD